MISSRFVRTACGLAFARCRANAKPQAAGGLENANPPSFSEQCQYEPVRDRAQLDARARRRIERATLDAPRRPAALRAQGEKRHLAVPQRRHEPSRFVRSEA